jgi:integrase/recombinase XerD
MEKHGQDGRWPTRIGQGAGDAGAPEVDDGGDGEERRLDVISPDNLDRLLDEAKQPYRAMVRLQYALGMRPGEVCKMRRRDVRLAAGIVVTPEDGKTGARTLYIDENGLAANELRQWFEMRAPGPYLFGGEQPIRVDTYATTISRYCVRAGIPHVKPYVFRHSYATQMMNGGKTIADIAFALGHASPATTARYYLHPDPEIIRRLNKGR